MLGQRQQGADGRIDLAPLVPVKAPDSASEFLLPREADGPFIFPTKSPFFSVAAAPPDLSSVPSNLPADESLLCAPTL